MSSTGGPADLSKVVAARVTRLVDDLRSVRDSGAALSALLDALELFIPQLLRTVFAEWETESLDGFFVANVDEDADDWLTLVGLAILISDQTTSPVQIRLRAAVDGTLERVDVSLGEPGGGALGISGPACTHASVPLLLQELPARLPHVDWVYQASFPRFEE